jgi:3-phosphoshikimate 1-carboxyvinyltransferase
MTDQVTILPSTINGTISAPPSKSESHRAIICAALSKGRSSIRNVILSEDIKATIHAIEAFGVQTQYNNHILTVESNGDIPITSKIIDCHESGSTLRFMIPLFSLANQSVTFTGQTSLMNRPLSIYKNIYEKDGFVYKKEENFLTIKASLKARIYDIPGNISSQFISGLLFALPLLSGDSQINIIGDYESRNYVLMTLKALKDFGVEIDETNYGYYIRGNQKYISRNYQISGDYSQAAYFMVSGAFSNQLEITNLDHQSLQGDRAIAEILEKANANISQIESGFVVSKSSLVGRKINIENCPDLGPIIALMCSVAKGHSTITGASRLRIKESDRIQSTVQVLKTLGANISVDGDDIHIDGVPYLQGGLIDSYNDHRIAMMASIAALVSKSPITIKRACAINKSYPHFYSDLESIGVMIKREASYENNPYTN